VKREELITTVVLREQLWTIINTIHLIACIQTVLYLTLALDHKEPRPTTFGRLLLQQQELLDLWILYTANRHHI
jgi:hypothetical protein